MPDAKLNDYLTILQNQDKDKLAFVKKVKEANPLLCPTWKSQLQALNEKEAPTLDDIHVSLKEIEKASKSGMRGYDFINKLCKVYFTSSADEIPYVLETTFYKFLDALAGEENISYGRQNFLIQLILALRPYVASPEFNCYYGIANFITKFSGKIKSTTCYWDLVTPQKRALTLRIFKAYPSESLKVFLLIGSVFCLGLIVTLYFVYKIY